MQVIVVIPVVPATREAEAKGSTKPRNLKPAWATQWDPISKTKQNEIKQDKTKANKKQILH